MIARETEAKCMKLILRRRHVFEVLRAVVRSYSVFVVHLLARRPRANERCRDEAMNKVRLDCVVLRQPSRWIGFPLSTFQHSPARSAEIRSQAPNTAEVANLIPAFVVHDRSPLFVRSIIGKCFFNQADGRCLLAPAAMFENLSSIAFVADENPTRPRTLNAHLAPYTAKIRDAVDSFPAWNWPPLFRGVILFLHRKDSFLGAMRGVVYAAPSPSILPQGAL